LTGNIEADTIALKNLDVEDNTILNTLTVKGESTFEDDMIVKGDIILEGNIEADTVIL